MVIHGYSWLFMAIHGYSWLFMFSYFKQLIYLNILWG